MQFSKEEWDLHGRPGKAHWAAWGNSRRRLGDVSGQEISNPDADSGPAPPRPEMTNDTQRCIIALLHIVTLLYPHCDDILLPLLGAVLRERDANIAKQDIGRICEKPIYRNHVRALFLSLLLVIK